MSALIELQAGTEAGGRLVRCAERLSFQLAENAEEHDADGTLAVENIALLKQAGYFVAPIPAPFGGQGVESVRDILVVSSRLARGDASTTIGLNMHLLVVMNMVRRWRTACHRGEERRAANFARSLKRIVDDGVVMAAAISEPNQYLTQPSTRATRNGSGWLLNGRKILCTMSPAATTLLVSAAYQDQSGNELYGYTEVPTDAPGVVIHDDWDALGMRASGSNSISFCDVHVPESSVRGGFPVGSATGYIERNLANGLFHASASVGIAEAAYTIAVDRFARRSASAPEQILGAENAISLAAMRASFQRAADLVEAFDQAHLASDATADEWHVMFAEVQAAKAFVGDTACRIVDRVLTLAGGAAYMRSHWLARAYRDVRASGFMQPLGSVRAYEYLAGAAFGLTPSLS